MNNVLRVYTKTKAFKMEMQSVEWGEVAKFLTNNKTCREVISGPCKPYYDIEKYYKTETERRADHANIYIQCRDMVSSMCPGGRLMFMDASGPCAKEKKDPFINSIHVIVNGAGYCPSGKDVVLPGENQQTEFFDPRIYGEAGSDKTLRAVFSHKEAEPQRPLRPMRESRTGALEYINSVEALATWNHKLTDYLVTHIEGEQPRPALPRSKPSIQTQADTGAKPTAVDNFKHLDKRSIQFYVDALSPERATDRDMWLKTIWGIQHIARVKGLDLVQVARDFAKRTTKNNYSEQDTELCYYKPAEKEGGITFATIVDWAQHDSPHLFGQKREVQNQGSISFYEDRIALLSSNPTEGAIQQWMLGCIGFACKDGAEEWYLRHRNGWKAMPRCPKNFPFSTASSGSTYTIQEVSKGLKIVDRSKTFMECLQDIKDTPAFYPCRFPGGAEFYPYFRDPKSGIINTFGGWAHPPSDQIIPDEDVAIFINHIDMMCGDTAEYVKNWLAAIIQTPRVKMPMIVFYSEKRGAGKDTFRLMVTGMLGEDYTLYTPDPEIVFGKFNGLCANKLLTFLDEAEADARSLGKFLQKMKASSMNNHGTIQKKFVDAEKEKNYSHYIAFTNYSTAVIIEGTDRSTCMVDINNAKVGDKAYFDALYEIIDPKTEEATRKSKEMFAKFQNWLAQRDISKFRHQDIPETEIRKRVKENSMKSPVEHFRQVCENKRCALPVAQQGVTVYGIQTLYRDYIAFCNADEGKNKCSRVTYQEEIRTKLRMESYKHPKPDNRNGYDFELEKMQERFREHLNIPEFTLEWQEPELDHL